MDKFSFEARQELTNILNELKLRKDVSILLNSDMQARFYNLSIDETKLSFGHFYHTVDYNLFHSLEGSDVLEIGGAIFEDFAINIVNARSWASVQKQYLIDDLNRGNSGSRLNNNRYRSIFNSSGIRGAYLDGELQNCQFDRVFSLACFEHVHDLRETLEIAYNCLRPGGTLYSYFTPIWSSESSHLPPPHPELDEPYYHLCYDLVSMYNKLISLGHTSADAYLAAYEHYKGESLNRFTFEEYELVFSQCPFEIKHCLPINKRNIDDLPIHIREKIKSLRPGIINLATGFKLLFQKAP